MTLPFKIHQQKHEPSVKLLGSSGNIYTRLIQRKSKLAVVGLGYVGLPIALEFARVFNVIGYDICGKKVEMISNNSDPSNELDAVHFSNKTIEFSSKSEILDDAQCIIVAVPTPINERRQPNLEPLKKATATVAKSLKFGDYIIFESTVYPGCTEEICVPILEKISGLKLNTDFKVGYSPERINPGDKKNTITTITKVVSGSDQIALENIYSIYETIIEAGVHKAPSIKVAEASKIIENTQRDVNIALMNEFSMICSKLNIDTHDVLEAAGTKWNFLKFYPGLVGGHCIGVDPYYLTYKARQLNIDSQVISNSRFRNDSMPFYIAQSINNKLVEIGLDPKSSRVLVKGITYKENVTDIRNSKVAELVHKLSLFGIESWVEDPHADPEDVQNVYGIECKKEQSGTFDVVMLAVSHSEYQNLTDEYFDSISHTETIFFDIKGSYKQQLRNREYMSL